MRDAPVLSAQSLYPRGPSRGAGASAAMPCFSQRSFCQSLATRPVVRSKSATDVGRSPCGVARRACRGCGKKSYVAECVTICGRCRNTQGLVVVVVVVAVVGGSGGRVPL